MTKKLTKTLTGIALSDFAETRVDARRLMSQCSFYALIQPPSPPLPQGLRTPEASHKIHTEIGGAP
ncbi:MAG TPA: hypothetical protein VE963_13045 [Reyranella sp.]|nr:hypothetical protein [Reyranella sp.]